MEEKTTEAEDEEGQPLTLERAIAGMNANADQMQKMAAQLCQVRREYDELVVLFALAHSFIDELRRQVASRCGQTHLCKAAKAFIESVEITDVHQRR